MCSIYLFGLLYCLSPILEHKLQGGQGFLSVLFTHILFTHVTLEPRTRPGIYTRCLINICMNTAKIFIKIHCKNITSVFNKITQIILTFHPQIYFNSVSSVCLFPYEISSLSVTYWLIHDIWFSFSKSYFSMSLKVNIQKKLN